MRWMTIGMLGFLAAGAALAADSATNAVLTRAEIDQKLAALSRRQIEISFELRDQARKNETLWLDSKYTSPEIEKLLQRLAALRQVAVQAEIALRQAVEALPEVRAELAKVPNGKAEYQGVGRQIEELQKRREQAP